MDGWKETEGGWRETNEQVFWYVELQSLATVFERSSNPLRPCFAGDENFRLSRVYSRRRRRRSSRSRHVFPKTFSRLRPLFIVPSPSRFVSRVAYLFLPTRRSPFDAANVSSSKQFFENTFGALKVAPFPSSPSPSPSIHETKDAARRPCFSPNGNTVTRLPWVCVCMYMCVCVRVQAKFANARYVMVAPGEKMEG